MSTRRLLLPLALIFSTILLVQMLALRMRSRASALEHDGQLRLAVAANQRLVVEQYERSSYLAGVALSTDNLTLLIAQRQQSTDLARKFEETRKSLADGGTLALGAEKFSIEPSANPEIRRLLSDAEQGWRRATASQVRMLRSNHKQLKDNRDLEEFRVHLSGITEALDQTESLLRAEHVDERRQAAIIEVSLPIASAMLLLGLAAFIYARMLRPLVDTTRRATELNTGLQLVLDSVDQGLLTVDRQMRASKERSAALERWLGVVPEGSRFSDALRRHDSVIAEHFDLSVDALFDGILPEELLLDQLPRRVVADGRTLEFKYRPISSGDGRVDKLLVMLSDITDELELDRVEAEQRELVTIFQAIAKDRSGFEEFLTESAKALESLRDSRPLLDRETEKRLLHTLKGNAAMFGMFGVSDVCHGIEQALSDEQRSLSDDDVANLEYSWGLAFQRSRLLLGDSGRDVIEVDSKEHAELLESAQGRASIGIVSTLATWAHEPVRRRFERFADQAFKLSTRLGKPPVEVLIQAEGVRLEGARWAGFWSAFVHAVRNAVDHGIESPEVRTRQGKAPAGKLFLNAEFCGDELRIVIEDDGAGISWARVKDRALAAGLPCQTHEQLVQALFHPGLTTKATATTVSGRGIGLDVLKKATEALHGRIQVHSEEGKGTTMEFRFPRSSAVEPRSGRRRRDALEPQELSHGRESGGLRRVP